MIKNVYLQVFKIYKCKEFKTTNGSTNIKFHWTNVNLWVHALADILNITVLRNALANANHDVRNEKIDCSNMHVTYIRKFIVQHTTCSVSVQ